MRDAAITWKFIPELGLSFKPKQPISGRMLWRFRQHPKLKTKESRKMRWKLRRIQDEDTERFLDCFGPTTLREAIDKMGGAQ